MSTREAAKPVSKIGRYKVLGMIGAGGMGMVYAARDRELGRRVALKILRPDLSKGDKMEKSLLAEAKTMARLSHPNICTVYEVGMVDDSVFLAMEYVDGQTLRGWLKKQPRTWHEIVEVMVAAGRGIQSAHDAGIVHRDIKPDNIMIDRNGRVRVMDFGIAKGEHALAITDHSSDELLETFSTLAGTPAYMSPELARGAAANQQTDQFSFAVSLYEALYGALPYAGETFGELLVSYEENRLHEPSGKHHVPRWLRQIVLKGVASDPKRRFGSIGELVDELVRVPRVRKLYTYSLIGALLLMVGVLLSLLLYQRSLPGQNPCLGSDQRLAEVWNPDKKSRIEAAMLATGMTNAADQWRRAAALIDGYSTEWVVMHTEACEATMVRGEQSDAMLDHRMLCLTNRKKELEEVLTLLEHADGDIAQRAVQAVLALDDVDDCRARESMLSTPSEPPESAVRDQLQSVRDGLAGAKVLYDVGRYAQVRPSIEKLASDAMQLGYPPVIAAAKLLEGRVFAGLDEIDRGEASLMTAMFAAERSGDDHTKLEALEEMVYMLGFEGGRPELAQQWADFADATVARIGGAPRIEAKLWRGKAGIAYRKGDYERQLVAQSNALELKKQVYGEKHLEVALSMNDVGTANLLLGRLDTALARLEEARAIAEEVLGQDHPVAAEIILNLGNAYFSYERLEEARTHYQRAADIWERFLGPKHSRVAMALASLGNVYFAEEEMSEAINMYKRALSIEEELLGQDHPNIAATLLNLGTAYLEDFETASAIQSLERAKKIVAGHDTFEAGRVHYALARARHANDEQDVAMSEARRALAIFAALGESGAADKAEVESWMENPI